MQAVVDFRYLFRSVEIGWCGRHHDSTVLQESDFFTAVEEGMLLPNSTQVINGVDVPVHIIGDAAYPLKPWLMKPYPTLPNMTALQKTFNYRHSRARMVVECAFGRLKGRWRCLLKRYDGDISTLSVVVAACCTLHNICEIHGDAFDESWIEEHEEGDGLTLGLNDGEDLCDVHHHAADREQLPKDMRNALAHWVLENNMDC